MSNIKIELTFCRVILIMF